MAKSSRYFDRAKKKYIVTPTALNNYYRNLPVAALHHQQLFPNNYLNIDELKNKDQLKKIIGEFALLLDNSPI